MNGYAKFWAVDLHAHTPGSADAKAEHYGTPTDIVEAALSADLDAIAVTDHNTAGWCDAVAAAATGTNLIVLPGVEISTTEGHLLAIFEEGTPSSRIEEMLIQLGISRADHGKLDVAAKVGIIEAAHKVSDSGGLAIAAHIDRPKGLLRLEVGAHVRDILLEEDLAALEVVDLDTCDKVQAKVRDERHLSFVRGSDTWDTVRNTHSLSGIGSRRTWVKAARPDLVGIRHALDDPDLRISLKGVTNGVAYSVIESVELIGGFLDGQRILLCPDLNCLLGGTGVGKSLIVEAIRYVLQQQVDRSIFPEIGKEVDARLRSALGENGLVRLQFVRENQRFRVERVFAADGTAAAMVSQQVAGDWLVMDADPASLITIAAFSQGEVLEYSRQPVGRMSLVDAAIDLTETEFQIDRVRLNLEANASKLLESRSRLASLQDRAATERSLSEQIGQLTDLFDNDTVKHQGVWQAEGNSLKTLVEGVGRLRPPQIEIPDVRRPSSIADNDDLFARAEQEVAALRASVGQAMTDLHAALSVGCEALAEIRKLWSARFEIFRQELDTQLENISPGSSLSSLRNRLESLQAKRAETQAARTELEVEAMPAHEAVVSQREEMLDQLHELRRRRRGARRRRVAELNEKAAGFVKLDVPNEGDWSEFRAALSALKVGSRVREDVLDAIARTVHPIRFARALLNDNVASLVDDAAAIDATNVRKLLCNIEDRGTWDDLLRLQLMDRPDTLTVKFKKPDGSGYATIENLAHGQKCTAILVILLADGVIPVLVDQPEDALHAPWIEEYLVTQLRAHRGSRQYVFATRSPGIVVSSDAEQIITMKATAGRGEIEACGSLERYDLNRLALHHLEGGSIAFKRRARKLHASTQVM